MSAEALLFTEGSTEKGSYALLEPGQSIAVRNHLGDYRELVVVHCLEDDDGVEIYSTEIPEESDAIGLPIPLHMTESNVDDVVEPEGERLKFLTDDRGRKLALQVRHLVNVNLEGVAA